MDRLKPFKLPDQSIRGRRALVTGATGFVGGRLAERLMHEHDVQVKTLVRNWTKAVWISRYPVEMVSGDIQDSAAVDKAAENCDIVFHCASGGGSDLEYLDTNIKGTQNVLNACKLHNIRRLIFISSIAVHGPEPPDGADEHDEYRSYGRGYSESKIAAERMVLEASQTTGLQVSIIRPTFVWGPRSNLFTVRPLREMQSGVFRLVNDGKGDCHAVFIETLVDAIISASVLDEAVGRAFLVTDGYGITWERFFAPYAELLSIEALPSIYARSMAVRVRCRVYQKLRMQLEVWKTNPAPLWRNIVRRLAKITSDRLITTGVMNEWDLIKYARVGGLNTLSTYRYLGVEPRYTFAEAMALTTQWVCDQMGVELQLSCDGNSE